MSDHYLGTRANMIFNSYHGSHGLLSTLAELLLA